MSCSAHPMQWLPRDSTCPHRLCPRSSLLPSSWCGPGHNDGVQRVTSPTTVPIGNVLRAHGWKNRHCLMELDETFSCLGSREGFIKKIYQKAGLGKTIRERSTSESAPIWSKLMVLHAWPCFFFFLANTCEALWHPNMSLFCPTSSSKWDSTLLLPGNPLAPWMEACIGILFCQYGVRDGNSLHLLPSPLLSKKLHTEKKLN